MRKWCALLLLLIIAFHGIEPAFSAEAEHDQTLLEDLGEALLKSTTNKRSSRRDKSKHVTLGEDVEKDQAAKSGKLASVVKHMEAAQSLLKQLEKMQGASSAQTEALAGMDAMIAELTQRQSQCKSSQRSNGAQSNPAKQEPNNGANGKAGKAPAKAAASQVNSNDKIALELAKPSGLVKDLWGTLPQRQREQILQPLSEEFLPKYAAEIEAYFRDLADPRQSSREDR